MSVSTLSSLSSGTDLVGTGSRSPSRWRQKSLEERSFAVDVRGAWLKSLVKSLVEIGIARFQMLVDLRRVFEITPSPRSAEFLVLTGMMVESNELH